MCAAKPNHSVLSTALDKAMAVAALATEDDGLNECSGTIIMLCLEGSMLQSFTHLNNAMTNEAATFNSFINNLMTIK